MSEQNVTRAELTEELRIKNHAFRSAMSPIAISDLEGYLTYVNPAFLEVWGYEEEAEVLGRRAVEFWQMEEQASQVVHALQESGRWSGELSARRKDDAPFDVQVAASTVSDDGGQPIGMMASFRDITEQKAVERELAESRKQLGTIIDALPVLVSYVDKDYRYVFVSKGYEDVFERDRSEIVGRMPREIIGEDAFQAAKPDIDRAMAGERVEYERKMPYATGARWTRTTFVPDLDKERHVRGMTALVMDITQRKQAEMDLAEEKAFSEALISSLPGVFYLFDSEGRFVRWNENFEEVSGYSAEELAEMTPTDFFQGEHQQAIAESVERVFREGQASVEADFVSKSGEITPYLFTGVLMELQGAAYLGGIGIDISDRREAEETLQRQREQLEEIVARRTRVIRQQTEEILELSTPILEVVEGIVAAPLIGTLDTRRARHFMDVLLERVAAAGAAVALVDITGVPAVDTQTAQHLIQTVRATQLLGTQVVLTGVRPSIAQSLVHLGIDLSEMITRSSLAAGLQVAQTLVESQR